jgi:hypothetical protein
MRLTTRFTESPAQGNPTVDGPIVHEREDAAVSKRGSVGCLPHHRALSDPYRRDQCLPLSTSDRCGGTAMRDRDALQPSGYSRAAAARSGPANVATGDIGLFSPSRVFPFVQSARTRVHFTLPWFSTCRLRHPTRWKGRSRITISRSPRPEAHSRFTRTSLRPLPGRSLTQSGPVDIVPRLLR